MNRKEYEEFEKKMNAITDPAELEKAMQQNEFELKRRAKLPIYGGLSGFIASGVFVLLAGVLSAWTGGLLWIALGISLAGMGVSTVGAIIARHKYAVFERAMRTRKKLKTILAEGKGHTAMERASLEKRLVKDLRWLQENRLISTREREIYGNVMRPVVARGGTDYEARMAEIRERAASCNQTMDNMASNVRAAMDLDLENNAQAWNSRGDNIEEDKTFDGYLKISSQSRNPENGVPCSNSDGKPVFDKYAVLSASSDKELALMLRGLSKTIQTSIKDGSMPFPIKIEASGLGEMIIDGWGPDGLLITSPDGIIRDGVCQFDIMAKEIYDKLPEVEVSEEQTEEQDREEEQSQEK